MSMVNLVSQLKPLAEKGSLRQLDYQFARFIYAHSHDDRLAFIAAVVSCELGKGHICLPLFDRQDQPIDLVAKLGLFGEAAQQLKQAVDDLNWLELLNQSSVVETHATLNMTDELGSNCQSLPLIFDGERLYLHRYFHYEKTLAERLSCFGSPMILKPDELKKMAQFLDHLFTRNYRYLFEENDKFIQSGQSSAVIRQRLVCDYLDVVDEQNLDWPTIDQKLMAAKNTQQLAALDELVPLSACVNWQKVAAAVALSKKFAVISGGPGTGKTTTVAKLLAALIAQSQGYLGNEETLNQASLPSIKLVAPTGKAAARLTESIGKAVASLPISSALKQAIPTEASTLHRLLGSLPNSAEFRYNRDNPLHLDILVVDEASMVDLPMMYKLLDALPKQARLILLGDKDQLASVEAGAVLGDICSFESLGFSHAQASQIARLTGFSTLVDGANAPASIGDSLCMLKKSYRFDARSGIGQLAQAVNSSSAVKVTHVWQQNFADIECFAIDSQNYNQMIKALVAGYQPYLTRINQPTQSTETIAQRAKAALKEFAQCRLLCAIRQGDFGVAGLNLRIERALAARKLIHTQDELWYHGRPVMVTKNDHSLGLFNGDIGICIRDDSGSEPRLKVFFELPDGTIKAVLPSRVPDHETAYAMTIHKSQGSEFEHTFMILPPDFTPILTRELIYTGITRAKKRLSLYLDENIMLTGIKRRTERASGLRQRLSLIKT